MKKKIFALILICTMMMTMPVYAGMSRDEIKGLTDRIRGELEKAYI